MPRHKRESLIYTIMMCFTMVFWMSMYNVSLHMGALNLETIKEGWLGFPIAYLVAMCLDWFLVSRDSLFFIWMGNIPKNFIMALPFQLIIAGPLVRTLFRKAFPEGTVLAEPAGSNLQ